MNHKIIVSSALPTLLIITGIFSYLALQNSWNLEIASYAIFLITLLYVLALERFIPFKHEWKLDKINFWTDIKHLVFSTALFDALGKILVLSFVIYIQEHFFSTRPLWDAVPFLISLLIANLIGEFLPYIYHKISHTGNPNSYLSLVLWKIHSIHHLPKKMNWFKTNWVHPINIFLNTVFKMLPILLLGFSKEIVFVMGITHIIIAYFSHANIQTKKSFWDYIIVTPHIHHFHHSIKLEEAKNFGNIFPFWDLVFGTYYNRKGNVEKVGLIESTVIIYPKDTEYFKQLLFPLSTAKDCCKN